MDSEEINGLIALLVVSSLSFFATLSVILVYIFNRKFRSFSHDLVIMLCISDFLYCLVAFSRSIWMLSDNGAYISGAACYIEAVYIQTFDISSCICTTSISYSLYLQMVKKVPLQKQSAFKMYWKRNYLIPLLVSLVFIIFSLIDHNEPYKNTYCTVASDNPTVTQILQMIYFYIPQIGSLIFNVIMISLVLKNYFQNRQLYKHIAIKEILSLIAYPLILLFCQIPLIVIRIMEYSGKYYQNVTVSMYILSQSTGFLNSLFYAIISLRLFSCDLFGKKSKDDLRQSFNLNTVIDPQDSSDNSSTNDKQETSNYSENNQLSFYSH